jgi:hypothetical protein
MDQLIDATTAILIAKEIGIKMTRTTIIKWCKDHKIGRIIGGRWYIDLEKFKNFLEKTPEKEKT